MRFSGTIFVEGDADLKFISDFVQYKFRYSLKGGLEIQDTKGKDNLHNFKQRFKESTELGLTNLIIFDADSSCQTNFQILEEKGRELDIQFDTFLFPNNSASGDLESLLELVINSVNAEIFGCYERFKDCINRLPGINSTILDRKTKIHNYICVLSDSKSAKEKNRDYQNSNHWDLDSEHLTPLYEFLLPHFIQDEN